jgi:hypothetical protein
MAPALFAVVIFQTWPFICAWASLDHDPIYFSPVAWATSLLVVIWGLSNSPTHTRHLILNSDLSVSTPGVARITGVSHHAWPNTEFFFFFFFFKKAGCMM